MKTQKISLFTLGLFFILFSCKKEQPSLPEPQFGTMTDIEGNVYETVKIGEQEWMAENLKVTKLNDGTPIPMVANRDVWKAAAQKTPMVCYYENQAEHIDKYGMFYNWYAVNTGKLAPEGWHVPSIEDWNQLFAYLIAKGFNYDGSRIENKIAKSLASTTEWSLTDRIGEPGNDQTKNNKSGFNGLPAGYRDGTGNFGSLTHTARWWTKNFDNEIDAFFWEIHSGTPYIKSFASFKTSGISVRCVKD
jgi:uncharacterized protein (TIGR02145 family)